jgi:6-phosphogluconolactonase
MTAAMSEVVVVGNLALAFAERFAAAARAAITARGRFDVALTGGSSAKLYAAIDEQAVDWTRTHLYWGDERAVPPDHADSNFRLAQEHLIARVRIPEANVHRMPGEAADLEVAARAYEKLLPAALDLVHLGLGPDGHCCSLFPSHALLRERDRRVAPVYDSPKPPPKRLTLTLPALLGARARIVTAAGAEKAPIVARYNDGSLPVVMAGSATWLTDAAAAGR